MPGTHQFLSRCTLYRIFNRFTNFNASSLSIYPSISSICPVFCYGVTRFLHHYPYVTSVCLTRTQMHLPQSQPLHRINSFAPCFHGFLSVFLLHSGHTSKLQLFHCFSILAHVLYAIWSYIKASIFPFFLHPINFHHITFILLGIIFVPQQSRNVTIVFPLFYFTSSS